MTSIVRCFDFIIVKINRVQCKERAKLYHRRLSRQIFSFWCFEIWSTWHFRNPIGPFYHILPFHFWPRCERLGKNSNKMGNKYGFLLNVLYVWYDANDGTASHCGGERIQPLSSRVIDTDASCARNSRNTLRVCRDENLKVLYLRWVWMNIYSDLILYCTLTI